MVMQIRSVLLTLGILGTSSLALADHQPLGPDPAYRDSSSYRTSSDRDFGRHAPRPTTWVPLTTQIDLDRRVVADISSRQRFDQLRLQNQYGRSTVRAIIVQFENGERQRVAVNRVLAGNHAMVNIDLDGRGRRIDKIIVVGHSSRNAALQLYAM
jgi:hypothetical protein